MSLAFIVKSGKVLFVGIYLDLDFLGLGFIIDSLPVSSSCLRAPSSEGQKSP